MTVSGSFCSCARKYLLAGLYLLWNLLLSYKACNILVGAFAGKSSSKAASSGAINRRAFSNLVQDCQIFFIKRQASDDWPSLLDNARQ